MADGLFSSYLLTVTLRKQPDHQIILTMGKAVREVG